MERSCLKGCFCSKAGFTLIELLVVVLIIGILAAVAVPQYQKAVEKSHLAEALLIISAVQQQAELYMLENGLPAEGGTLFEDFASIDLPASQSYEINAACISEGCFMDIVRARNPNTHYRDSIYFLTVATYLPDEYVFNKKGNWYYGCVTNDTDIGRYICSLLEKEGWGVYDGEY